MPYKKRKIKIVCFILIVFIVGILLRFYGLPSESIWIDEITSIESSSLSFMDIINPTYTLSQEYANPPFYTLFLKCWRSLSGNSEFALRFPSAIFGAASVLLVYFLANLLLDRKTALLSAFIFSINPFHIYLSQQARMYSLFALFSLLSLFYFFRLLKENKKIDWFFYLFFSLLNLYTHYFAIFVLSTEMLYFILFYKKFRFNLKKFIITNIAILILFSPQFIKIYNGFLSKTSHVNWGLEPSKYFISIFDSFLGWNIAFTVIVFLLFLFGLLKIKNADKKLNLFGLFYVLIPLVFGFLLSFKIAIMPRYFVFILPVYIIFISKGLTNIKYKFVRIVLILGILFISGFKLAEDYSKPNHAQWRETVEHIKRSSQENDLILFDAGYTNSPFEYYYKGDLTRVGLLSSANVTENEIFYNGLNPKLKSDRVWLILPNDFRTGKYYKYRLEGDFKLIDSRQFAGVKVYLYEKD